MKKMHVLAVALALVLIYVGCYFLLVRPAGPYTKAGVITSRSPVVQGSQIVTLTERYPDYRGAPERLFRPLHYLDCQYFRPSYWYSTSSVPWPKGTTKLPDSKVEIK